MNKVTRKRAWFACRLACGQCHIWPDFSKSHLISVVIKGAEWNVTKFKVDFWLSVTVLLHHEMFTIFSLRFFILMCRPRIGLGKVLVCAHLRTCIRRQKTLHHTCKPPLRHYRNRWHWRHSHACRLHKRHWRRRRLFAEKRKRNENCAPPLLPTRNNAVAKESWQWLRMRNGLLCGNPMLISLNLGTPLPLTWDSL